MKNKQKIIISLTLLILFLLSGSYSALNETPNKTQEFNEKTIKKSAPIIHDKFIVGTGSGPADLDPADAWDQASLDVIDQVCEGLFWYNFSTPDSEIIPKLAASEGTWSIDGLNYTVPLRTDVFFHDGTKFNSTAVKFTFDRLLYLTNATGMLPMSTHISQFHSLYEFMDGTPIINRIEIVDEYTVRFILNDKYGALVGLLSFEGSFIISPASTPALEYIDTATGDLVGTGPFVYDGYIADVEVNFHAFEDYWNGVANITKMQFNIINLESERYDALINGDIHFLDDLDTSILPTFEADPDITVIDEGKTEDVMYFVCMNNENINKTWRQAISHAINYTYIIEEVYDNSVVRTKSSFPEGVLYFNATLDYATLNVTKARLLVQSMGFGTGLALDNDAAWINVAQGSSPFASWNYSYNTDNQIRSDLGVLLTDNLAKIGIDVIDDPMDWAEFVFRAYGYFDPPLEGLYWTGWGMDFNDPSNMLIILHSNGDFNYGQVDDSYLDTLLDLGLAENDPVLRKAIYDDIQQYLVETLLPYAFTLSPKMYTAHHVNLTGFHQSTFDRLYFYQCNLTLFPNPDFALIYIDDNDPLHDWNKLALENDWCTGSGTLNDPYVIKNIEIDGQSIYNGIEIHNSHVYFTIENCTLHDLYDNGILLVNTNNSLIHNNTIYNAYLGGIRLESSNNHTISLNKIWNSTSISSGSGISLMFSNNCDIYQNSIKEYYIGIASGYNVGTMILNNNVTKSFGGIITAYALNNTVKKNYLFNNTYGILLQETNETIVKENQVVENAFCGIGITGYTVGCHNNSIIQNQVYDNDVYGVVINNYTSENEIFLNEFIGNAVNAQNNGTLNEWDNGAIGNFWDDYPGNDLDDDGIGDDPYLISGTSGSYDNYPIWDDGESSAPIITVILPVIDDNFGLNAPEFNISIFDDSPINSTWYTMDDGTNNLTITALTGTLDGSAWTALPDGTVTITFYANDTLGNIGSAQVTVYKDTVSPVIIINDPTNADLFGAFPPLYDIDITESNLDTYWYTMDDGANNLTIITLTGTLDGSAWTALPDGSVTITFYANDTSGNIGSAQVTVSKDIVSPVIIINDPTNGDLSGVNPPVYDIDITESNLDTYWYTMDDGANNLTMMALTGTLDGSTWTALPDGAVTITFYANDTLGNIGSAQVTVYKDTLTPVVVINDPNNADLFGAFPPEYNITITEANIDSMWYTVDGGANNLTITALTGTLDVSAWSALPDGFVIITFYANDTSGKIGFAQVMGLKDGITPVIVINDPSSGEIFSINSPTYDIDITESYLDTIWYTMDGGITNFNITVTTGTLDGSAWTALPDGTVTIIFYANDTSGNIGFAQVMVNKDTVAPVIAINNPDNGDEFTTNPPIYDVDITEPNLDTVWYTMDGGINNITITEYTGSVDSTLWSALPIGSVTITFYANDTIGHIGSDYIIVYKNTPTTSPGIPGPNAILITLILLLGTIGLGWRSKNKLKLK